MARHLHPTPHEAIHKFHDRHTGLRGIIAIHSTALGPGAGGCRIWPYATEADALRDVLKLSEGMTYKNALADLPFGGAKAVIDMPKGGFSDREAAIEAFGRVVESLGGRYVTAEDVGSSVADMEVVGRLTRHVAGLPARAGQAGGDPSPWTALGVFLSIEALVRRRFGSDLCGVTVGVQGLGHVGWSLCEQLHAAGAHLAVADIDREKVRSAVDRFSATAIESDHLVTASIDVFAPCALGGVLTEQTVAAMTARIVCGAANNQLHHTDQGAQLAGRGILYAPDYLVNAGGIINVSAEFLAETPSKVRKRVEGIPRRLLELVDEVERSGEPMNVAAERRAQTIVTAGRSTESDTLREPVLQCV